MLKQGLCHYFCQGHRVKPRPSINCCTEASVALKLKNSFKSRVALLIAFKAILESEGATGSSYLFIFFVLKREHSLEAIHHL